MLALMSDAARVSGLRRVRGDEGGRREIGQDIVRVRHRRIERVPQAVIDGDVRARLPGILGEELVSIEPKVLDDVVLRLAVRAGVPQSPSALPVRKFWNAVRPFVVATKVKVPCVGVRPVFVLLLERRQAADLQRMCAALRREAVGDAVVAILDVKELAGAD